MRNKVFAFLAILIVLIPFCPDFSFGQTNPDADQPLNPPSKEILNRFYSVTTFIPVTLDGQFFNGLQTICGYRINDKLFVGGGIGYEYYGSMTTYEDFKANLSLLPVFADIRYTFLTGRVSPVIAVNGGYKFLLNKASTQTRYDTIYTSVLTVLARNDYADYNIFNQGGPFFTAEAGLRIKVYRQLALYLSADYTLSTVTGDYYLSNKQDLLGSDNVWRQKSSTSSTDRSLAYIHQFFLRLGITF